MKTLQELIKLHEDARTPLELKDAIPASPPGKRDTLLALINQGRLVWGGKNVMDIYDELQEAASQFIKEEVTGRVEIYVDGPNGTDINVEIDAKVEQLQEVYMAYDPENDAIIMGFDMWLDVEDQFNQVFDEEYERETGEVADPDDEGYQSAYRTAWDTLLNDFSNGFYGVAVSIEHRGGQYVVAENVISPQPGGFYGKVHQKLEPRDFFEIRLD